MAQIYFHTGVARDLMIRIQVLKDMHCESVEIAI